MGQCKEPPRFESPESRDGGCGLLALDSGLSALNCPVERDIRMQEVDQSKRTWIWLAVVVTAVCVSIWRPPANTLNAQESQSAASAGWNESRADGQANVTASGRSEQTGGAHNATGTGGGGHESPGALVMLAILVILLLAKIGADLFERMSLPPVLGELTVGVVLGNFVLMTDWHVFDFLQPGTETGAILEILAEIGVVLLLFEVGLESGVGEMLSVGASSMLVAVLGVIAPIGLGWLVGWWLIPEEGWQVHVFIGATLCATSVGITARVLKDMGRIQQTESRIVLGAAVIDDVLGLVVLAIVSGAISQGEVSAWGLLKIVGLAFGFLAGAMLLGVAGFPRTLFRLASFLRGHGLLVATALVICFGFAYSAYWMGLEPIVGAFAAGLILEGAHYGELGKRENRNLEEALAPLSQMLVPVFFVEMGIKVRLETFGERSIWELAAALTVAAILGKQVCGFGVLEKGLNRLAIGLGMIPRGEVGLIFARVGQGLTAPDGKPVISDGTYSAVVMMVIITTMCTPPVLKWALTRRESKHRPSTADDAQSASPET